MVKKEAIWLAAPLLLIVLGAAYVSATADIAYIYRRSFNIDQNILDIFDQYNLTYDLIDERTLPINFGQYKLLFVGDENFRNENRILVNQYPSIVANYYHADYWGLTDAEGVSQLGADHPLSVKKSGRIIQVYTQGRKWPGGPSVVYYYLDVENRAPALETVALTEDTASGDKFGDVISYASPGDHLLKGITQQSKLCFFGLIDTDYWTPAAKTLFTDCLGYVGTECNVDTDCPAPVYGNPFCQANSTYRNVTHYSCQTNGAFKKCVPNKVTEFIEDCPYGCENGQCIGECETDLDCGASGLIGGLFCIAKNVSQTFELNTCAEAGTSHAHCISEIVNQTQEVCEDICIDGACFDIECFNNTDCSDGNSSTEDICHGPGTIDSFCTNSPIVCFNDFDCGTDGFIGSRFCSDKNVTRIFETHNCENPGTAASFCTANQEHRTIQQCLDVCINGACAGITCYEDSDCNDLNSTTLDECINPGTVTSECRNTPINCASDNDCGFTGFLGTEFCSGLNVMKAFQNATCFNSGTLNSYCTLTQQDKVLEHCDQICVGGSCLDVTCASDADCNDFDSLTLDECINPGTVTSECRNTPINCASDNDCGFTGYLGDEYCSTANNVSKNFQTADCVNPGQLLSYCDLTVKQVFINECAFACYDGMCIRCDENSDCNDGNPNTVDLCMLPDTPASYCKHEGPQGEVACFQNSDCGVDTPVGSPFCVGDDLSQLIQSWTCHYPGTSQSYCSTNPIVDLIQTCPDYCLNGACVDIACFNNNDCSDGNSQTLDICHNPGTPQSFCTNNPIGGNVTCSQNSDCGVDTPISPFFCTGTSITQLLQTWQCLNPGTPQSFCSSKIILDLIQNCPEYCSDGQCLDIECFNNNDCNDHNSSTLDICHNPGTPQSFCTNNPVEIICSHDSDCGTDGFIGNPFCLGLDVIKLFQEYDCHNPGTVQSYCSTGVSEITIEECDHLCINGECIPEQGECTPGEIRPCGTDTGECSSGINVCLGDGSWSSQCFGEIPPTTEICDGLDNDCDGQIDEGGVCGSNCTNDCSYGSRRCSGNGYQVCGDFDSDSCSEWSQTTSCSYGEICENGYCITPCTNDCSPLGLQQCFGNDFKTCGQYDSDACLDWSTLTNCGSGKICDSGQCVSEQTCQDECVYGSKTCEGDEYKVCGDFDSDSCSEWSQVTSCSYGQVCVNGQCTTPPPTCQNECSSSGQRQCSGSGYKVCGNYDADSCLEWSQVTSCSYGQICDSGYCTTTCQDDCVYGSRRCAGNGYQVCGDFDTDDCAEWSQVTSCSYGQVCSNGLCI